MVASIALPELFDSQLIVFFGSEYWSKFFDRQSPEQRWNRLGTGRSISQEWGVEIPAGFAEQGFEEIFVDGDYEHRGEFWFIGDLSAVPNLPLQPTSGGREATDSKAVVDAARG